MTGPSVRQAIETQLRDAWASIPALAGVRVIATERALDDIQRPTALIRLAGIGPFPQAPQSHRTVSLLLTLISGHADLDKAGDQLETIVFAALDYLDTDVPHGDATAVAYGNRLAYDIPLHIIASKD